MNVFLYSICGESAMLVQNLRSEDHEVIMYIDDPSSKKIFDGLVWKTEDPDSIARQADLVVFDDNGKGTVADRYRAEGLRVWNGGTFVEKLEYDRTFGMKVFRDHGIPTPDTYDVSSVSDVQAALKSEFARSEKCVIKISGDEGAGTSFSFIAEKPEQMIGQVQHWDEDGALSGKWKGILQRFIEGIEVSVEAWWNGESWSNHNLTIEEKKCWPGNLGPSVGCAFNTIARIAPTSRLFRQVLDPIAPLLKKANYVGQIDTNSIVDSEGVPHALEFTPRAGYDATPTLVWGDREGYGNAVAATLNRESDSAIDSSRTQPKGPFWCGVRVHIPPYPFESKDLCEAAYAEAAGTPVDVPSSIEDDFYMFDVMSEEGKLSCSGANAIIGIALGGGSSPSEAGRRAYRVAERVKVPNKAYRALDGFKRAEEAIPELISMGLIKL